MRFLAIDLGAKRTGLATGDDETGIVSPGDVIVTASDTERLRQIGVAIESEQPDALVLGLPLNMDGSAGPAAKTNQTLAAVLKARFGLDVHLVDERLTSADANDQMARTGLTRGQKKARRDALAAANILRRFLETPQDESP
ncbi:MAG: Holliday junction resolvase RuvX [Algisphaera sp.]